MPKQKSGGKRPRTGVRATEADSLERVRRTDVHSPVHIATGMGEGAADLVRNVREPFRSNVLFPKGKP